MANKSSFSPDEWDRGAAERDDGGDRRYRRRAQRAVGDAEGEHGGGPRADRGEERCESERTRGRGVHGGRIPRLWRRSNSDAEKATLAEISDALGLKG